MTINVTLHNTDQGDLFVSVLDNNQAGSPMILNNQRINTDQTTQIGVQEDGGGVGNITWNAQRTDDPSKTAQRTVSISQGDNIDITTHFG